MSRIKGIQIFWLFLGLFLFGLALFDLSAQIHPDAISRAEPFFYWANTGLVGRLPLALLMPLLAGAYLFLRKNLHFVRMIPAAATLLILLALVCSTLLAPMLRITRPAVHLQSLSAESQVWHLYYQMAALPDPACDYMLVACDALGLRCQWRAQWRNSPVCLGEYASIRLLTEDESLRVWLDGETVYPSGNS